MHAVTGYCYRKGLFRNGRLAAPSAAALYSSRTVPTTVQSIFVKPSAPASHVTPGGVKSDEHTVEKECIVKTSSSSASSLDQIAGSKTKAGARQALVQIVTPSIICRLIPRELLFAQNNNDNTTTNEDDKSVAESCAFLVPFRAEC